MKVLSREDLKGLIEAQRAPSVSIYMPAHRTGDTSQDPIRLRNLLKQAEERLQKFEMRSVDARAVLAPAQDLLPDTNFWQHQGDGLALFLSKEMFRYYQLPREFQELVVVTDRFHVKPLLPLFSQDGNFFILALSRNLVRLLQCTRYSVREVTPEEMPSSLAEALQFDQREKQLQFRSSAQGGKAAIFHGHGAAKEMKKSDILRYFQKVNQGMSEILRGEQSPLVLAAVDYLHPIYRKANTYQYLMGGGIEGNPDEVTETQLQRKGWALLEPYFEKSREEKLGEYRSQAGTGSAIDDVERVARAAYNGLVSTLFVAAGKQEWGLFDEKNQTICSCKIGMAGAQDILDFAAVHTLANGGEVYVLEPDLMPTSKPLAAILRYASA